MNWTARETDALICARPAAVIPAGRPGARRPRWIGQEICNTLLRRITRPSPPPSSRACLPAPLRHEAGRTLVVRSRSGHPATSAKGQGLERLHHLGLSTPPESSEAGVPSRCRQLAISRRRRLSRTRWLLECPRGSSLSEGGAWSTRQLFHITSSTEPMIQRQPSRLPQDSLGESWWCRRPRHFLVNKRPRRVR